MAWSSLFLSALEDKQTAWSFRLEVFPQNGEPGVSGFSVASLLSHGSASGVQIVQGGVEAQGATLSPRGWTTTIGSWSVRVAGDLAELCANITKGTIVQLRACPAGWAVADAEPIALGQVRSIRSTAPEWTIEVLDILSALKSRITTTYTELPLFSDLESPTLTIIDTVSYSVGAGSLRVVSTTGFSRQTGGLGLLKITPVSTGADPFYLTYTGVAVGPTRFTGLSATGQVGTTASVAAVGDLVEEVGYVFGHPIDIARKILQRNGTLGLMPSLWNMGLLGTTIDQADANDWRDTVAVVASGTYRWDVPVTAPIEDGYSWLSALLAGAGFFMTTRQGMLTVRCAQDTQAGLLHSGITIADADIAAVESYDAWDVGHEPEYGAVLVRTDSTSFDVSDSPATLPAQRSLTYDVRDRVFGNTTEVRYEMEARLVESARGVPERLVLRCAGLRMAQLAPGDLVTLSTSKTSSRRDGAAGWSGRVALVDEVSPEWAGASCRVGLLIYPETNAVFG